MIGRVETPETIVIKKTKHDIMVTCDLAGFHQSREHLKSKIQDATWGNIVAGGLIGWGIDSATGSDNKYEKYVTITMVPLTQPPPPPISPDEDGDRSAVKPEDAERTQPAAAPDAETEKINIIKPGAVPAPPSYTNLH